MGRISPPFLELQMYYRNQNENEKFLDVLNVLLNRGATIEKNVGSIVQPNSNHDIVFSSLGELQFVGAKIEENLSTSPNGRLMRVELNKILGKGSGELTYNRISEKASQMDTHPIALLTSGQNLNVSVSGSKSKSNSIARNAYKCFIELAQETLPTYAAITVEYGLECLTDLRDDPRSLAFGDFYISNNHLSKKNLNQLLNLYSGAYIETLEHGVYISCSGFNPKFHSIKFRNYSRASQIIAGL